MAFRHALFVLLPLPRIYRRRVWHPCHTHAALCQSSHGIHGIHRSFWRRRASHRFHRCTQMVRLRRVLWEDSLVAAWVWQGCHTLLICVHPCNLWETILRQKLLWFLWVLWEDSLVAAWVWQGCHTLLICAHPCNLWETILRQKLLWFLWVLWEDSLVAAWVWQGCHTLLQLHRLGWEIAAKKFVGLSLFYYFCTK